MNSSNGTLTVNRANGNVISCHGEALANIKRFDLEEFRAHYGKDVPDSVDILDLGYWDDRRYIGPDNEWRKLAEDPDFEVKIIVGGQ